MPMVEKWRAAAAKPVDAFTPDDQPVTYEPPQITKPKFRVAVPPSRVATATAMRGKYVVRKASRSHSSGPIPQQHRGEK